MEMCRFCVGRIFKNKYIYIYIFPYMGTAVFIAFLWCSANAMGWFRGLPWSSSGIGRLCFHTKFFSLFFLFAPPKTTHYPQLCTSLSFKEKPFNPKREKGLYSHFIMKIIICMSICNCLWNHLGWLLWLIILKILIGFYTQEKNMYVYANISISGQIKFDF